MIKNFMKKRLFINVSLKTKKRLIKSLTFILALFMFLSSVQYQNFVLAFTKPKVVKKDVNPKFDMSNVIIDYEIKEKRDKYTKYFRKIDGTYEVSLYNEAVHYLNNNKWDEIDNSLILDAETDEYQNMANAFKIKLPKKIDDNKKFKIKTDDYEINWNILDINESEIYVFEGEEATSNNLRVVENVNKEVLYHNVFNNVDLEYIIKGDNIKENFILNEYTEDFSVKIELGVKNLSILKENDKIYFVDDKGNKIYNLGSFIMYDGNLNESKDINVSISEVKKDNYLLTITPSDSWLKSRDRVYPVKIDPTIYIYNNGTNTIKDVYSIYKNAGDITVAEEIDTYNLKVGYNEGTNEVYRSYFEFNLNDDVKKSVVTYANLNLNVARVYNGGCIINLKEIGNIDNNENNVSVDTISTASITPNNNLNNYYGENININTFDYEIITSYELNNPEKNVHSWDMTRLFQKWVDNNNEKGIIELSSQDEGGSGYVTFYSSNIISNLKPVLVIGYVDSTGLVDAWTYHNQDGGFAGVGYTNDYTGNVTFVHLDSVPVGNSFSFGISHIFDNQKREENIGYGYGWRINYSEKIEFVEIDRINKIYKYRHVNGDGSTIYFDDVDDISVLPDSPKEVKQGDVNLELKWGKIAEDGSGKILRYYTNTNGTYEVYTVQSPSGMFREFVKDNSLKTQHIKYIDTNNNQYFTVNYFYDTDKISNIIDEKGNKAIFYYISEILNRIEIFRINELNEPEIYQINVYEYDENNNLIDIIDLPKEKLLLLYKKQEYKEAYWQNFGSPSDWILEENEPNGDTTSQYIIVDTKYDNIYQKQKANRSWKDLLSGQTGYEAPKYALSTPSATGDYRWVTTGKQYTEYLYKKQWYNTQAYQEWVIDYIDTGYAPTNETSKTIGTSKWENTIINEEYYYNKKTGYHTDKVCLGIFKEAGFLGVDTQIGTPCYWVDTTPTTSDDADLWENKYLYYDESLTSGNYLYTGNGFNYNGYYVKMDSSVSKGEYYVKWTSTYADNSSYQNLGHKITSDSGYGWYTTSNKPANSHTSSSEYFTEYYYNSSKKASYTDIYGVSQLNYYRYKVDYVRYLYKWFSAWQDLNSGQTGYEVPKYATSTPTASSGYRWVSTGTSRIQTEYKKQVNSIDSWEDIQTAVITGYEPVINYCPNGQILGFNEDTLLYTCGYYEYVYSIIESRDQLIAVDSNTRWNKLANTERIWHKYQKQNYINESFSDLVSGDTGYEQPVDFQNKFNLIFHSFFNLKDYTIC